MDQVRAGVWRPRVAPAQVLPKDPTFHAVATDYLATLRHKSEATINDRKWQITKHLLPYFHSKTVRYDGPDSLVRVYGEPRRLRSPPSAGV